ncbi:MAG TPA: DUF3488 and transglutaminase-like domain-containing protein [Terriglobales bacterium]|nr:DUF3488 and transglutaminase-like domain-containing protein [Terriglobales bacterium]
MPLANSSEARSAHPVIQRFFEISLYLLLFTGFSMLAGTGKLDGSSVLLGLFALVVRGYMLIRQSDVLIPEHWTNYLTLGYLFFFAVDYFFLSRNFLGAIVHMVLFAAMVKIFSVHRDRDYVYLGVLSFGMVLTAAVLTVDSLFFGTFCVFVLLAVLTFVTMEMRRAWIAAEPHVPSTGRELRDLRRLPSSVAGACVLLVVTIVVGTIALFFLIPRKFSAGYLSTFAAQSDLSTGFSEEVRLGEIGQIQQSGEIVMHVKFAPGTRVPGDLRWRGIALTNFDGHKWTGPRERGSIVSNSNEMLPAMTAVPRHGGVQHVRYRVSLEPFGSRVFFVLPEAVLINGRYQMVSIDSTGTIFNADLSRTVTDYGVLSQLPGQMPATLDTAGDPGVEDDYLRLPMYLDARIAPLAQRIAANESTDYRKALAIENYLLTSFKYTLQLPPVAPKDPVANFLFDRKMGHCEYFASSMAVMLRTLGIPSRVVNGFHGGEYNDVTGSYIIRAKDAHSWVEAYVKGYGWHTFDPTPASQSIPGTWNRAYLYLDALREFWHEWVVNYDSGHQTTLALTAARHGRSGFEHLREWCVALYESCVRRASALRSRIEKHARRWASWTAAVAIFLAALLIAPKLYRKIREFRITRRPRLQPQSAATIWYARALKLLSKRGMRKSGTQTSQEFAQTVTAPAMREHVNRFTILYEQARFGESTEAAEKLPELYRELEEAFKK